MSTVTELKNGRKPLSRAELVARVQFPYTKRLPAPKAEEPMHHVTRFDPADLAVPAAYADGSEGYRRVSHIDRSVGAVHTGFGTCELAPGGTLNPHVHSY